jgi:hypothetical protein
MILARRSSPAPSARHICRTKTKKLNPSPAFGILSHPMGEEQSPVGAAYSAGKFSTPRRKGAKSQGIFALRSLRLCVFALILSLMIPLLRSLIHLRRRFYKYASPTDFAAFASFARQKIQTPIAPNVHRKMILARRSSQWDNRK